MAELYRNAVCLAPMVRAGTLPLRLLALRYGADLVYSEEIIDKRMIATTRVENDILGSVDFVSQNGDSVVFRTCPEERGKVVFQIGTADPALALQAALKVAGDVAAIDVNMGCPKHFSIQGGMGAALLKKQDVACEIVRTLSSQLSIPVSAKIRLFADPNDTITFAQALVKAGAVAIGVHARHVHERPAEAAHWEALAPIVSALAPVPVLVNGDIFTREDLARVQNESGATSCLIARGALANVSIFRMEGMLPVDDVVAAYLRVSAETDNAYHNTKYNLSRMIPAKPEVAHDGLEARQQPRVTVPQLAVTKGNREMFALWPRELEVLDRYQRQFEARAAALEAARVAAGGDALDATEKGTAETEKDTEPRRFYCAQCQLQLLSEKDVALHVKGKKHKKKARMLASVTLSERVARNALSLVSGHEEASTATVNETDEPARKRLKPNAELRGDVSETASPTEPR